MKKIGLIALSMAILGLPLGSVAFAHGKINDDNPRHQGLDQDESNIEKMCEKRKHRFDKMTENKQQRKEKRAQKFDQRADRLNQLVEKATNEGKDTSKIKADLQTLKQKMEKLEIDQSAVRSIVEPIKDLQCDKQNIEKLKEIKQKAKPIFDQVKADHKDIRDFRQNVINPELKNLGIDLPEKHGDFQGSKHIKN